MIIYEQCGHVLSVIQDSVHSLATTVVTRPHLESKLYIQLQFSLDSLKLDDDRPTLVSRKVAEWCHWRIGQMAI